MSFAYSCYLFFCFMFAYTLEVDTGNYKGLKALLSLYKTMTSIRAEGAVIIVQDIDFYKGPKAL